MTLLNLLTEQDAGILTITVNRPDVRNAMDVATWRELSQVIANVKATPSIRVVIITGAGPHSFVAGSDIRSLAQRSMVETLAGEVRAAGWPVVTTTTTRIFAAQIALGPKHLVAGRHSLEEIAAALAETGHVLVTGSVEQGPGKAPGVPVDWIGNAWGGHVGLVFAATRPARCRSLATFGTPVQAYGRSEQVQFRVLLAVYRVVGMIDPLSGGISDVLLSPQTRANDPVAVALVRDSLRAMRRRSLANAMLSISLGRPDLTSRLASIQCPTLFVTGPDHAEWTPEMAETSARRLADGTVRAVPGTAYLTPLEAPEATLRCVREFWAAHAL